MAGIYIHIPFCSSRCIYCDFFSTTQAGKRAAYVDALCREIASDDLPATPADMRVRTIYIGGGTPSLLTADQLERILQAIHQRFDVAPDAEITLEMNPDDVSHSPFVIRHSSLVISHSSFPISHSSSPSGGSQGASSLVISHSSFPNRISLGIQSFHDPLLRFLRRRHDAETAINAVGQLQEAGIHNISIDLIYGLPGQTMELWQRDLDIAFSLGIQHLSAYALSYEEGTALWHMRQQGSICETDEETMVNMYELLCQRAQAAGFDHYEISNFALPGFQSRHNSSYWTGTPYLGFGPGAHSYDGLSTRWSNHPDLDTYLAYWGSPTAATPASNAAPAAPTAATPAGSVAPTAPTVATPAGNATPTAPTAATPAGSVAPAAPTVATPAGSAAPAAPTVATFAGSATPTAPTVATPAGRVAGGFPAGSPSPRSIEHLTEAERYDEFVMCGLRTRQGIDLEALEARFGHQRHAYLLRMAAPHLNAGTLALSGHHLHLTQKSLMTSDDVMSDLMA